MDDMITISSGDNLNNYTQCGNYLSPAAIITDTLDNCPMTGSGFVLRVERTTGGSMIGWCRQCIVPNKYIPVEYWRTMSDGNWSGWVKINGESLAI